VLNQIYYSVKNRLHVRLIALAIAVLGNMFFLFMVSRNDFMEWQAVLGVVFASFAFLGIFVANIIVSDSTFKKHLTKEPSNYLMTLAPVPAWKKILGTLIPSVIFDTLTFSIGIIFIVVLSVVGFHGGGIGVRDMWQDLMQTEVDAMVFYAIAFIVVGYAWLLLAGTFGHALSKTVLSRVPLRKLAAVILTVAVLLALSWTYIIFLPFGEIHRFGLFFTVLIHQATHWHLVVSILLLVVQAAMLLFAAAQLLDRRS